MLLGGLRLVMGREKGSWWGVFLRGWWGRCLGHLVVLLLRCFRVL